MSRVLGLGVGIVVDCVCNNQLNLCSDSEK